MPTEIKNQAIETLKEKFSQYSNFYITNTESLSVAQITKLRSECFSKNVEMKVAKNTLIRKALESLDAERFGGTFDALHGVTALMFSDNPKEPALILSDFRGPKGDKPVLKAAFIDGELFIGDDQLKTLKNFKTKNDLIGEIIGLLQSPISTVLGALENKDNAEDAAPAAEEAAPAVEAAPEAAAPEAPEAEAPAADPAPEA